MANSPPSERRLLRAVGAVRRDEWPLALLMFGYFFLVIATFWILKPIKKGLFIEFYDKRGVRPRRAGTRAAQAELHRQGAQHGRGVVAVVVFTWLARRSGAQRLRSSCDRVLRGDARLLRGWCDRPATAHGLVVLPVRRSLQHADGRDVLRLPERQRHAGGRQAPVRPRRARRRCGRRVVGQQRHRGLHRVAGRVGLVYVRGRGVVIVVAAAIAAGRLVAPARRASRRSAEEAPRGNPAHRRRAPRLRARPTCSRSPPSSASTRSSRRSWTSSSRSTVGALPRGRAIGAHSRRCSRSPTWLALLVQLFLTQLRDAAVRGSAALLVLPATASAARCLPGAPPLCGRQRPQHRRQRLQLLDQPVRQGSALRPDDARREVQGQGVHRHVRAALRQGGGGRREPRR